jgi:lysyl-tRNA synthetase class 2
MKIPGRITRVRRLGKNLLFMNLHRSKWQIVLNRREFTGDAFNDIAKQCTVGNILEFEGREGTTPSGQLSIFASRCRFLAQCNAPIPLQLLDPETRFRNRALDMIVNPNFIDILSLRARMVQAMRDHLSQRGYIEVETPILSALAGGANARPFTTQCNALDSNLELRVAPELYLKQLIVGGMTQVFEIGKQFRNEGVSTMHNPEFTMLEAYHAYAGLEDLYKSTHRLLREAITSVAGSPFVDHVLPNGDTVKLDFDKEFARLDIVDELTTQLGEPLPPFENSSECIQLWLNLLEKHQLFPKAPHTISRILDFAISELIEPKCIQPTCIYGHPLIMSPLAKESSRKGIADRFEIIIAGKEYANAYVELNDATEQRARFASQSVERNMGDSEALGFDVEYCNVLDLGMPPTVGFGIGIDRLCMLATGSKTIREVLSFPILKPVIPDKPDKSSEDDVREQ